MQILVSLILISFMITNVSSAAFYGKYEDADHPGKCVLNDLILSPGDVHDDIENCSKTSCYENSMIYYVSCGVFKPPDDCIVGERKYPDAPHPDCCEHHITCNTV